MFFIYFFRKEKINRIVFVTFFMPPQTKKVAEEYLLYDTVGVIGAVGGTLGLCIGFSMFGAELSKIIHLNIFVIFILILKF